MLFCGVENASILTGNTGKLERKSAGMSNQPKEALVNSHSIELEELKIQLTRAGQ